VVPIVLSLPAMVFTIPPLVILAPATFPFGIQIPPPVIGFAAMIASIVDCLIQSGFGLFNRALAFLSVIGMHKGCSCKHEERPR
jgi:hypothetical protein